MASPIDWRSPRTGLVIVSGSLAALATSGRWRALGEALDEPELGWAEDLAAIRAGGLDMYGGCYNYRPRRSASSLSVHAWAAAIDIAPEITAATSTASAGCACGTRSTGKSPHAPTIAPIQFWFCHPHWYVVKKNYASSAKFSPTPSIKRQ